MLLQSLQLLLKVDYLMLEFSDLDAGIADYLLRDLTRFPYAKKH
jgi:hypothetical protein